MTHAAMLLGRVTHAANNCRLAVVLPDGSNGIQTCRDAQQCTGQRRGPKRQRSLQVPPPPAQLMQTTEVKDVATLGIPKYCKRTASQASLHAGRLAKVARAEQARSNAADAAHVQRLVESICSRSSMPAGRLTAEERRRQVLERVRAKAAAAGDRA